MHSRLQSILALVAAVAILGLARTAAAGTVDDVKRMIVEEAAETGVPASLAMAIAKTGSDFRPDFKGPNGARGVMQILPETAEGMGVTPATLWQPRRNVQLGLEILSHLLQRTEGDWAEAVAAYNAQLFRPGSDGASRRVADTLQWERRFAEQIALQDPVQARRREVIAGHDSWRDDQPPAAEPPAAARTPAPAPVDRWSEAAAETPVESRVEVVIVEQRPIIVEAPRPRVIWRPAPAPRVIIRQAPPPRVVWQAPSRPPRLTREERRHRRWLRQMAGSARGNW